MHRSRPQRPQTIAIRDCKSPEGPILRLTPTAWAEFTASLH
ncbi:DUF397 domain-containing protein [Streptomyces sp. NPDC058470]